MAKGRKTDSSPGEGIAASSASDDILDTVRGLAEVVTEHALSELIVERAGTTITLRRGSVTALPIPAGLPALPALPSAVAPAAAVAAAPAPAAPVADDGHVVTSPFVGTFYRRPNPDSPEYVRINDRVERGQVLCIVEAMKLMNEIEADVAGTITGILAEDGAPVEYGQPLFKISPG
jgi:acetyl-CoA carboxylase biotin carboxyl carrier protein